MLTLCDVALGNLSSMFCHLKTFCMLHQTAVMIKMEANLRNQPKSTLKIAILTLRERLPIRTTTMTRKEMNNSQDKYM